MLNLLVNSFNSFTAVSWYLSSFFSHSLSLQPSSISRTTAGVSPSEERIRIARRIQVVDRVVRNVERACSSSVCHRGRGQRRQFSNDTCRNSIRIVEQESDRTFL